ncbi:MAG TPA: hypothetical protein DCG85_01725 [Lachnospiraceae bacterium]|nr:hypothetical protein [Lachnospiraceae bacterium]
MKIIEDRLKGYPSGYSDNERFDPEKTVFLDIETTGFSAKINVIYEIGAIVYKDGDPVIIQYFAEKYDEEKELINAFFDLCKGKETLIHFNGNTFDIPFIRAKAARYGLTHPFDEMEGIDIYQRIAPFKAALGLSDCKLKTIESFLNIKRDDELSGGELIEIYKHFVKVPDEEAMRLLILHNHDDMKGMLDLIPILSYSDLLNGDFRVTKVFSERMESESEGVCEGDKVNIFVKMKLVLGKKLPAPLSVYVGGISFKAEGNEAHLCVPMYEEEMKYFYKDYKEYFYLPEEDMAIHKSVSMYVDKERRKQAKAYNCYTRKKGSYLPEFAEIITPVFKRSYDDKICFFEVTDEIKKDPESFKRYASHIIKKIIIKVGKKDQK